jgi:hypothetical protein
MSVAGTRLASHCGSQARCELNEIRKLSTVGGSQQMMDHPWYFFGDLSQKLPKTEKAIKKKGLI